MSDEVDYLLSILGKEEYATMDWWLPPDPADKNDAGKFLDYLESTLNDKIFPCVRVYELEDVKKTTDETMDVLIDYICKLTHCALIGDGSDEVVEFEVQWRMICAIPDGDIELWKELLKVSCNKDVSHLLAICDTYYAIESGAAAICAGKTINAVQKSHGPQKQPQKHPSQCQNCIYQHPPGHDNCPAWESVCKGCLKKGHWQAKYHSSKNNQSTAPVDNQSKGVHGWHERKGKKAHLVGVHTEETPYDDILLDDVCAPHTNEAYTTFCLPASFSKKGMASLWVKVNIGGSVNVLPLCLFRHLYPNGIDKTGHPTGLNMSSTRLNAYNGIQIPLFGSLHGPISWQPGSPSAYPYQINSCWYVADNPDLPSKGSHHVRDWKSSKLNCAVKVIHDTFWLPGPAPAPPTPKKIAPIKSTEDLIKKFPDRFQGIVSSLVNAWSGYVTMPNLSYMPPEMSNFHMS